MSAVSVAAVAAVALICSRFGSSRAGLKDVTISTPPERRHGRMVLSYMDNNTTTVTKPSTALATREPLILPPYVSADMGHAPADVVDGEYEEVSGVSTAEQMAEEAALAAEQAYEDAMGTSIEQVVKYSSEFLRHSRAVIKYLAIIEKAVSDDPFNPNLIKAMATAEDILTPMCELMSEYGVAIHVSQDYIEYPLSGTAALKEPAKAEQQLALEPPEELTV